MDKKVGLSVAIVVLIILGIAGYFGFTKIQTERVSDFIAKQEKAFGDAGQEHQSGLIGTTYVSAFYTKNTSGQKMPAVEQAIREQVNARTKESKTKNKIEKLFFVQSSATATTFPGIQEVNIQEATYQIKGLRFLKKSADQLGKLLVTDAGETFQFPSLFTDFEAAKSILSGGLTAQLAASGVAEDGQQAAQAVFATIDWNTIPFRYENGQLVLTIPEQAGTAQLNVPVSSLYEVIQRSYLPEGEVAGYDAYQAEKARQEALKKQKLVALTFDDGPSATTTPTVLDLLDKYKAKGTFFVMGSHIPGNEALLQRMEEAGHEIGNHTTNHPNLTTISAEQVRQEVQTTQDAIQAVVGHAAKIMRPPYGSVNAAVSAAMNLPAINWSVDTEDWKSHNPTLILQQVKNNTRSGSIVLMHDIHAETVATLESILQYLTAEGYTFVTVSELLGDNLDPHAVYFSQDNARLTQ